MPMSRKDGKHRPSPPSPSRKEIPRNLPGLPDSSSSGDRICWRFRHMDHEGPWNFDGLSDGELGGLMKCLASFESMTMAEAFRGGHPGKDYDVENMPNALAHERLDAIGMGDLTCVSRFRVDGRGRLYGIRCGNVFHVIWWDRNHEVWPSEKRNT
jgi:Cu/Ag efflux protein CusF